MDNPGSILTVMSFTLTAVICYVTANSGIGTAKTDVMIITFPVIAVKILKTGKTAALF